MLYSGGTLTDLGTLGGIAAGATGINDSGQIVGSIAYSNGSVPFLYSGGNVTYLWTPYDGSDGEASGINDSGQIVGTSFGDPNFGFLYSGGTFQWFQLGGLYCCEQATAINNSGQVVGSWYTHLEDHAFLYSGGTMTDLGTLGGPESAAYGINDQGQVVGWSQISGTYHAFLYSGGGMIDLGTLGGGTSSLARGINNSGQVVGESFIKSYHAFLYSGGRMIDLNTIVSLPFGLDSASAINDLGQIVAAGGDEHSYLLTPVVETLTVTTGDGQTSTVGTRLPKPLVVKATDQSGNPVSGVPITFQVTAQPQGAAGAVLSVTNATTAGDGTASTQLKLGNLAGQYQVTASCDTGYCSPNGVVFTETASARGTIAIIIPGSRNRPVRATGCPNNQHGVLDSISVPANQQVGLAVSISQPAPPGGYYFQLSSEDLNIAVAGVQPVVFIPEGQTVSNVFSLYGVSVGTTALDVTPKSQDFQPFSVPITAWDVNPGADTPFLNANYPNVAYTCRDPYSPNLSNDPRVLAACGFPVQGAVSDGVSQLLLRLEAGLPGTACFEIVSPGPPDQGTIQTQVADTKTVGNMEYGFSFYQAPNGYGDNSDSRTVEVQFFFTPNSGFGNTSTFTASLAIVRPPLLLVHGLWGNPSSWPSLWDRAGEFYVTHRADYSGTNAANYSTNFPLVQLFVADALQMARDNGYAATQADVTAHSMGGLLTRLYVGSREFKRPDNFDLGDVYRLVTLDTPHFGASTANLLVSLNNNSLPFQVLTRLSQAFRAVGFPSSPDIYKGAVCDLAENSAALQGLSSGTTLWSQVIAATGGPPGAPPDGGKYLPLIEGLLDLPLCVPDFDPICLPGSHLFPQDSVNGFRFRQKNDGVVPLTSQAGDLGVIPFPDPIHTNVTDPKSFPEVKKLVLSLLDGPDSGFASTLPPVPSDGLGDPRTVPGRGSPLDQQDYSAQCSPGGPMNPNGHGVVKNGLVAQATIGHALSRRAADQRVQVTSPANGQQFAPGDAVNATVQLTPPLAANAGWLSVGAPGLGVLEGTNYNGSTYQVSFVLPDNYAGPLTVTPDVIDSNSNPIEGVGVTITVRPKTAPLSLTLVEGSYNHLLSANAAARVYVTGIYENDVHLDLTSSVTGTTYKSSSNQVLTVDTEGNVQAKAFGTAVVMVQNSGLKAFATFAVEDPGNPLAPQDLTAGLSITRSGFRIDQKTGFLVQTIQFTNSQTVPVSGPLYFVATDLSRGITLVSTGTTRSIPPIGSPYIKLHTADGITLQPGERLSLTLRSLNPRRKPINYVPKVFRTLTTP